MKKFFVVLAVMAAFIALTAETYAGEIVFLGQRMVNFRAERDVIHVTAAKGNFQRLQLSVHNNGLILLRIQVHYGNGQVQNLLVNSYIAANSYSHQLDLPGNHRVIQKVVFWYQTKGRRWGKAIVKLWGIRRVGHTTHPTPQPQPPVTPQPYPPVTPQPQPPVTPQPYPPVTPQPQPPVTPQPYPPVTPQPQPPVTPQPYPPVTPQPQPPVTPQPYPPVTPQPYPPVVHPPTGHHQMILLGQRWAGLHADRDVIQVTAIQGHFSKNYAQCT